MMSRPPPSATPQHIKRSELGDTYTKNCDRCGETITMGESRATLKWMPLEQVPSDSKIELLYVRHRCKSETQVRRDAAW